MAAARLRIARQERHAKACAGSGGTKMQGLRGLAVATVIGLLSALAPGGMAGAQDYPTRPITMIVPFPAGGATDTLARFLAEAMRPVLGQPVIIENVGGAAGSIGVTR